MFSQGSSFQSKISALILSSAVIALPGPAGA